MRFRPANTRVINRRDDRFDRHSRCFPLAEGKQRCKIRPPALLISGHSILEGQFGKGRDRSEIIWLQTLHFIYDRILGKPKQDVNVSGGFVHAHVRDPLLFRWPKEALAKLQASTTRFFERLRWSLVYRPRGPPRMACKIK